MCKLTKQFKKWMSELYLMYWHCSRTNYQISKYTLEKGLLHVYCNTFEKFPVVRRRVAWLFLYLFINLFSTFSKALQNFLMHIYLIMYVNFFFQWVDNSYWLRFFFCEQVWRVSWNVTGTVLSSSGDDGCVRLWKGILVVIQMTSTIGCNIKTPGLYAHCRPVNEGVPLVVVWIAVQILYA